MDDVMIPFNDLGAHYGANKPAFDAAVAKVLQSGSYILGDQVQAFEEEFARYIGVRYCVGVASGTEAIALALMALGIGSADEVITTNITAFPTITGIMQSGARPVVVDINPSDGLIDCSKIESAITPKTRAIVPVHLYGQCCDLDEVFACAKKHGLVVVEDAAQAAGSTYKGKKAGSMGHCNAFSFYPTKNLGAFGDGGCVTTNDADACERLRMLRNYGQRKRYYHDAPGINSRLDELQAAILRVGLPALDTRNSRRTDIAARYRSALTGVSFLAEHDYGTPNNHLFVIRHQKRDELSSYLSRSGIQTLIHYPIPVHRQAAFPFQRDTFFQASDAFANTALSLPLYPELPDNHVETIIEVTNGYDQ
jgi:dTDP-4-amino-4,6-dideoxygalactose transaminase